VLVPPSQGDAGRFLAGDVDEVVTRDRRDAPLVRATGGRHTELARFEDSPIISTFATGAPPWNNPELRRAISGALNRPELARRLFAGRAAPSGPIAPVFGAFALPESELAAYPGYRAGFSADASDARARWEAAGGPALGPITIDFPSIFDPRFSASSVVAGMLAEVLGSEFRPAVETYTTISTKVANGAYGNGKAAFWFGWGPPFAGPEPTADFLAAYGSLASDIPALSGALARLDATFGFTERAGLLHEASRLVLEAGSPGVVPWLVERAEVFRWPHYVAADPSPFWTQHLDAGASIDATLESYSTRR
ncbi:MAG: ABC transporter substrate-binding protein, partial [Hyphomicrobiales bacterium]